MTNMEKLIKIFENKETAAAMNACTTVEEVLAALKDKGLEITAEELKKLMADMMNTNNATELNDEELAEVDGGINMKRFRERAWNGLVWLFTPKNAFEYKPDFMPEPFDFNRNNDI